MNAFVSQPSILFQNLNLEKEMGTSNKPPKLLMMEYIQPGRQEYLIPKKENGTNYLLSQIDDGDKATFLREKKMLNLFQEDIKAKIFQLLQHNDSCYSIWQVLLNKDRGNLDMRKSKVSLLEKEFDIFTMVKGESFAQLIERYCHLVNEMKRLGVEKPDYEYIDKPANSLPEKWGTFIMIQQSNLVAYARLNLARFLEKLVSQELELTIKQKMKTSTATQDIGLYYKTSPPLSTQNPKV
ncbi:uncharacterized protein LOC143587809 [Bidens hawaiensis]|uniref:uncharacterized protein LOC143587809 n=1 Tax=Bidens hawaiensis TaxID=980011 RepID=UPI00404A6D42